MQFYFRYIVTTNIAYFLKYYDFLFLHLYLNRFIICFWSLIHPNLLLPDNNIVLVIE